LGEWHLHHARPRSRCCRDRADSTKVSSRALVVRAECRPIDGSSRMYITPEPIRNRFDWRARMRCASASPDKVSALRFKVRVTKSDVAQESQTIVDFLDDLDRYFSPAPARRALSLCRRIPAPAATRQCRDFPARSCRRQIHFARREFKRVPSQSGQGLGGAVLGEFLAHRHRFGLVVAALEIPDDALEGVACAITVPPLPSRYLNSISSSGAAEQHQIFDLLRAGSRMAPRYRTSRRRASD